MRRSTPLCWTSRPVYAVSGLLLAALSARPAVAQGNLWVAVAVSPSTYSYGGVHAYTSQALAESGAVQDCQLQEYSPKDCKTFVSGSGECVAVSMTSMAPSHYAGGKGPTREGAAAEAQSACVKAGGLTCNVRIALCSSDNPRWNSPLPLPPGGQPGSVDPALVGLWKRNVNSGIWIMQISANGTYTFYSEATDNTLPNAGTFTTSNGKFTLHAINTQFDDQGTYTFPSSGVMEATGKTGPAIWFRIAADPGYPAQASGPASMPATRR